MARKKEHFQDIALQGLFAAGSYGTAGQVLKSDGDNVYWDTAVGDATTLDGYDSTAFAILASANKFTQPITVNVNPLTTGPALPTGTLLHLIGTNATQSRMFLDTFGANAAFLGRRANGTNAAPSAILSGDFIFTFGGFGYGTTGYIASASALGLVTATENFTDTAAGAKFSFRTIANGTITPLVRWHIENDGSLIAEGLTVTGNGTVNAVDYFDNGVNINTIYANATNTLTMANKTLTNPTINAAALSGTFSGAVTRTGVETFNLNAAAAPAAFAGTIIHVVQADAANPRILLDGFGAQPTFTARRANGTNASKTAMLSGESIGNFNAMGYGATGYSANSRAAMAFNAAENWTDSAQGTRIVFSTTPNLSASGSVRWGIENDGSFVYNGGSVTGNGTVNAIDYFDNGVNINTIYAPIASPAFTSPMTVSGASPELRITETDASANETQWRFATAAGDFYLQALTDNYLTATNPFIITRTGTTIDSIQLVSTALTWNGIAVPTISSTDTFTNKTLTNPTINAAALSGTLSGTATFSGNIIFSGGLNSSSSLGLNLTYASGSQGSSLQFAKPASGSTLAGNVNIDINGNTMRIYEVGGSFRGVYFDLTTMGSQSELATVSTSQTFTNKTLTNPSINAATLSGTFAGAHTYSGQATFTVDPVRSGAAGTQRMIYYSTSGAVRWAIGMDSTAESGSNAGSPFSLFAFTDAQAYNGTALSFNRSTLAATFGGTVSFTGGTITSPTINGGAVSGTFTGSATWSGAQYLNGNIQIGNTFPNIGWYASGAAADAKYWRMFADGGGGFVLDMINDAYTVGNPVLIFARTAHTSATASFSNLSTFTVTASSTIALNPTGSASIGGSGVFVLSSNAPDFRFYDSNAGLDLKQWRNYVYANGSLGWSLVDDAYTQENFWLTVVRTAHTSAVVSFPATVTGFQVIGGSVQIGTAANPRITMYNNSGTASTLIVGADSGAAWIGTFTNASMGLYANSVQRMLIQTDGNIRFYNNSAAETFAIQNTGTDTIAYASGISGFGAVYPRGSGTNSAYLFLGNITSGERGRISSNNSRDMVFSNDSGASNHMLLGPTGNLTVSGQIAAGSIVYATNGFSATSSGAFEPQINLFNTNNDNSAGYLILNKNPADTTMTTGDYLGSILYYGRGTSSVGGGSQIVSTYTGTRGTNWVSSQLQIGVTNASGVMQWTYFNTDGTISGDGISTSASSNTLVKRDPNGYIFSNYINTTDDVSSSSISYIIAKFGDNYHRSASALKVNTFLLGTPGSSTYQPVGGYTNSNQWGSNLLANMNQAAGNTLSDQRTGFFTANNPTNSPNGDWVHWINHFGYGWGTGAEYGFQIAHNFWNNGMWVRKVNNGTWGSWVKIWTGDNDGAGSGLDADTVDGYQASSLFRTDSASFSYRSSGTYAYVGFSEGTTSNPGYMSWHTADGTRRGYIGWNDASNITLTTENGWGFRINGGTAWHSGNDGAGSGLDADTLDGANIDNFLNFNSTAATTPTFNVGGYWGMNAYYDGVDARWEAKVSQQGWFVFRNGGSGTGLELYVEDGAVTAGGAVNTYASYMWRDGDFFSGSNKFWHAGNDGADSGLDADTLDTFQGSQYLRSDVSATNSVDLRSPIFYDSNNTGFYVDPAGTSNINTLNGNGKQVLNTGDTYLRINEGGAFTAGTWFGSTNIMQGTGYFASGSNGSTTNARVYIYGGTFNGTNVISLDGSNGIIDASEFRIKTDTNNRFGAGIFVLRNASPTVYFQDTDHNSAMLHCNSNLFYVLRGGVDTTSWVQVNGAWPLEINLTNNTTTVGGILQTTGTSNDMRSPIFYDSNNTGFYCDPNSTSNLNGLTLSGLLVGASSASTDVNTANDTGSFSVRGSSTTIASMSFHRTGAYAINMGLGTDNVFRLGGWSASNNCIQIDGSGNLTALANITAYSDAKLKKDVETIDNAVDLVSRMRGVKYTRIDSGKRGVGVIAQEMLEVLPEVVQQGIGDDTTLSVAYGNIVGVLIEAIKEQQQQINRLEEIIKEKLCL